LDGVDVDTHLEALDLLKKYGFPVNPHIHSCKNIDAVIDYCHTWEDKRHSLPYETDGLVLKVNSFEQRERLGSTSKSVRWARAFKFPAEQAKTTLLAAEFSAGSPAVREQGSPYYFCSGGVTCPAQLMKRLGTFAHRDRMDVSGLGEELAKQLVKTGLVRSITDLYRLNETQLVELERMGKKSAQNLLKGIA